MQKNDSSKSRDSSSMNSAIFDYYTPIRTASDFKEFYSSTTSPPNHEPSSSSGVNSRFSSQNPSIPSRVILPPYDQSMDHYGYCYSYPPYDQLMDYLRDSSEEVDFLSQENASLRQENATLRLVDFLSRENAVLRQENATLRLVNTDLKNQLTKSSPESPSLPIIKDFSSVSIGDNNGIGGGPTSSTKNNNHRVAPSREAPVTSPTSVLANHDKGFDENLVEVESDIFSLAKSISTRHNAYLNMNRLKPPPIKTSNRLRASAAPFVPGNTRQVQQPTVRAVDESKKEEVDPLVYYYQGMPKTELCNKWQRAGVCPYGFRCQFAHGVGELRPVIRHPKYRTVVCRTVLAGYICPFGHRCHFRHALTDQDKGD